MSEENLTAGDLKGVSELLKLMAAYQQSHVLFTFVELKIADLLSRQPQTGEELAKRLKINPLAAERFLNACVAVRLLDKVDNEYANAPATELFLVEKREYYLGGQAARHRTRSLPAWTKLTENLQEWQPGTDSETDEDQNAEAMKEQHNLALVTGAALAEVYDFSKHRKLLDLGGGTAATSIALCRRYDGLETIVFDLPENIEAARTIVAAEKLSSRISLVSGDFRQDDLPAGFDAVLLANFMSVAEEKDNHRLLERLYAELPLAGACILSGWIVDDSRVAPPLSALFCLEDICWNAADVERSEKIYAEWLRAAGFSDIKCEMYLEPTKILYGIKSAV